MVSCFWLTWIVGVALITLDLDIALRDPSAEDRGVGWSRFQEKLYALQLQNSYGVHIYLVSICVYIRQPQLVFTKVFLPCTSVDTLLCKWMQMKSTLPPLNVVKHPSYNWTAGFKLCRQDGTGVVSSETNSTAFPASPSITIINPERGHQSSFLLYVPYSFQRIQ